MGRPKKIRTEPVKLEELTQIDGRDQEAAEALASKPVSKHRTTDAILGFKHSPYKTDDIDVYIKSLRAMNKFDLADQCTRFLLQPKDDRELMISRLAKKFREHVAATRTSHLQPEPIMVSKAGRDILSRMGNRNY